MRKAVMLMLPGLLLATATAQAKPELSPEEQFAKLTHGAAPGKPVSCISRTLSSDSQRIKGLGIVYRIGRTYYLNRFTNGCSFDATDIMVTSTPSSQLCRGDTARLIDNASRMFKGACIYDDFIPYERAK